MIGPSIFSVFAFASDTLVHVCAAIARILHLDRLVAIGHGGSKAASGDDSEHGRWAEHENKSESALEAPPASPAATLRCTVTVETLSPRAFTRKAVVSPAAPQPEHEHDAEDASLLSPAKALTAATQSASGSASAPPKPAPLERVPSEHNLLAAAADARDAPCSKTAASGEHHAEYAGGSRHVGGGNSIGVDKVNNNNKLRDNNKLRGNSSNNNSNSNSGRGSSAVTSGNNNNNNNQKEDEDLDRASTESNATDDTEDHRVRALDGSFAEAAGAESGKRRAKENALRHTAESPTSTPTPTKRRRGSSIARRLEWSPPSSDDEGALKAKMYAESPRFMPDITRTSFSTA